MALLLDAVCVSGEDVAASAAVNGDDGVGVSVQDHGFRLRLLVTGNQPNKWDRLLLNGCPG